MALVQQLFKSFIPVTLFNRGKASQIFDRLHNENRLIVLKNNQPSAVILSTKEYDRLSEIEENYNLLLEAQRRLSQNDQSKTLSETQVMNDLGITEKDLTEADEPEFE